MLIAEIKKKSFLATTVQQHTLFETYLDLEIITPVKNGNSKEVD